jgi:hypothetical protein
MTSRSSRRSDALRDEVPRSGGNDKGLLPQNRQEVLLLRSRYEFSPLRHILPIP